jgi:ankyrin repeat protein
MSQSESSLTPLLQLLEAAAEGDVQTVARLLEADPALANASGEYGKTPLHWAAERNDAALAEVLLNAGAEVSRVTSWGASPLEWAGYLGNREVADLLLTHGAAGMNLVLAAGLGLLDDVKAYCESGQSLEGIPRRPNDDKDVRGWPPDTARMQGDVLGEAFQVACRNGHLPVAQYLLERGAAVDAKGYFGGTGLHWAAIHGHRDVVAFLLEHGADANLEDHGFHASPTGWALEGGHDDVASLIRRHLGFDLEIER